MLNSNRANACHRFFQYSMTSIAAVTVKTADTSPSVVIIIIVLSKNALENELINKSKCVSLGSVSPSMTSLVTYVNTAIMTIKAAKARHNRPTVCFPTGRPATRRMFFNFPISAIVRKASYKFKVSTTHRRHYSLQIILTAARNAN